MLYLKWKQEAIPNDGFYQTDYLSPQLKPFRARHNHNYPEIIYIQSGPVTHFINENKIEMRKGDLVLIRPFEDIHNFKAESKTASIMHIYFRTETLHHLQQRYFADKPFFSKPSGDESRIFKLNHYNQQWFEKSFESLQYSEHNLVNIELFILNLWEKIKQSNVIGQMNHVEDWLRIACKKIFEPEYFIQGSKAFIELSGRSPEYTARELKKRTGKTISELITEARMLYASNQLSNTRNEIIDISLDCGFKSLSHFYKTFKEFFGITPNKYRKNYNAEDYYNRFSNKFNSYFC